MTLGELARKAAIAMWYGRDKFAEPSDWELQTAGKAVAVALEQAAKTLDERANELVPLREAASLGNGPKNWDYYNDLIGELEERATDIRALIKEST